LLGNFRTYANGQTYVLPGAELLEGVTSVKFFADPYGHDAGLFFYRIQSQGLPN